MNLEVFVLDWIPSQRHSESSCGEFHDLFSQDHLAGRRFRLLTTLHLCVSCPLLTLVFPSMNCDFEKEKTQNKREPSLTR